MILVFYLAFCLVFSNPRAVPFPTFFALHARLVGCGVTHVYGPSDTSIRPPCVTRMAWEFFGQSFPQHSLTHTPTRMV